MFIRRLRLAGCARCAGIARLQRCQRRLGFTPPPSALARGRLIRLQDLALAPIHVVPLRVCAYVYLLHEQCLHGTTGCGEQFIPGVGCCVGGSLFDLFSIETPTTLRVAVVSTPLWKQGPHRGSRELHLVLVRHLPKSPRQPPKGHKGASPTHNGDAGRRRQAAHEFQARDEGRLVDNSDVVPTTIRRVSKQWTGLVLTTPCRNKFSGAAALQRSPAALLVLRLHQRRVLCAFLAQFVTWRRPAHPGMEYRSQ